MKFFVVLIVAAAPALAHDTWIAPGRFTGACGDVTLHLMSAATFGKADTAIDPSRVAHAVAGFPDRRCRREPIRRQAISDWESDFTTVTFEVK